MKNTIKNTLFGLVMIATPVYAGNSIEVLTGNNTAFIDLKTNNKIEDILLLTEAKPVFDYKGNLNDSYAYCFDVMYGKDLGPTLELQAPTAFGILPRLGVFAQQTEGNLYGYVQATASTHDVVEIDPMIVYKPKIGDVKLDISDSSLINIANNGNKSGVSKNRVGVDIGKYTLSMGLDINFADGTKPKCNIGPSIMARF